jgi:hypothetical protein
MAQPQLQSAAYQTAGRRTAHYEVAFLGLIQKAE